MLLIVLCGHPTTRLLAVPLNCNQLYSTYRPCRAVITLAIKNVTNIIVGPLLESCLVAAITAFWRPNHLKIKISSWNALKSGQVGQKATWSSIIVVLKISTYF